VHCHIARKTADATVKRSNIPRSGRPKIIMKLLAKTADNVIRRQWPLSRGIFCTVLPKGERKGRIDHFALGEHDGTIGLLLPEKRYGRFARDRD